jgi:hypothetical protein
MEGSGQLLAPSREKGHQDTLDWKLGGPQNRYWRDGEEEHLSAPSRNPSFFQ